MQFVEVCIQSETENNIFCLFITFNVDDFHFTQRNKYASPLIRLCCDGLPEQEDTHLIEHV